METLNKYSRSHIGEEHTTKEGYTIKVIDGGTKLNHCLVDFDSRIMEIDYRCVKRGTVKNPYHPTMYGVGYLGIGKFKTAANRKILKPYSIWKDMLERVYSEKHRKANPTYANVTVCKEWHNYQIFAEWFYEKSNYQKGWELDKDLLSMGSKQYSPNTCVFISKALNTFLANLYITNKSGYPGVCLYKGYTKYVARIPDVNTGKRINLGYFDTAKEASKAYEKERINQANIWKTKLKGVLPEVILNNIK